MTIEERIERLEEMVDCDQAEEISLAEANELVSVGRNTFVKILMQNRREIDVEKNPATGWCIFPSSQSGRYRIFKRRFRDWWANNPSKTVVKY